MVRRSVLSSSSVEARSRARPTALRLSLRGVPLFIGVVLLVLVGGSTPAFAASGSDLDYGPVDGYSYYNYNVMQTSGHFFIAVGTQNGVEAPTGYIGGQPIEFTASGSVCQAGTWGYSTGPSSYSTFVTYGLCGPGYYYARGWSRAFNGNGYSTYHSYRTPNVYA